MLCADFFLVLCAENPTISESIQQIYAILRTRSRTLTLCTLLGYCLVTQSLPTNSRALTVTLLVRFSSYMYI
jgi:hypothetical protein